MSVLESINPATGDVVGTVTITPVEDIQQLVTLARQAQPEWAALGADGRRQRLMGAAKRMLESADRVGRLLTEEMGKPLKNGVGEVKSCGKTLVEELDEMVRAFTSEIVEDAWTRSTMSYDPLGVCAVITPWNFPFSMPHWMIVPALMAGNTVVFKPSEETPLVGQAYAELLGADLPPGVLTVVHGADAQGKALVSSAVDLIAFTGSRDVGKHIFAAAAPHLKRVILELGGKDPMVVLDDADIAQAAKFAARNSFSNAGQVCVSTERIYVPAKIADGFVSALVDEAERMSVGNGLDGDTRVGPLVNRRQRDHVERQLTAAVESGARLLTGGAISDVGCFMTPAVLDGVDHSMDIANEETFGPVACVIRVSSEDEAIRLANESVFGLGATVFGQNEDRTKTVARQLNAGMVGINRGVGGAFGTPWVGARESGYGYHKSISGHRQFAQVRVISERKPRTPT